MSNPLVAEREDSTKSFSGVPILESVDETKKAIESGDWASGVMGAVGTGLDALSMALDPFGSILAAGVGWLMEHVGPLSDALDALTGDADQIKAHSETWKNVAAELGEINTEMANLVSSDTASWVGAAGDAYRKQSEDTGKLIEAAKAAAEGASEGVGTAGEVVAAVRTLVRDIIAELVGHLISWALQVLATLGIAMAWVVPQVVTAVAKTVAKIADVTTKLVKAMKSLGKLMKKLGDGFGDAKKALDKIKKDKGSGPKPQGGPGPGSSRSLSGGGSGPTPSSGSGPAPSSGSGGPATTRSTGAPSRPHPPLEGPFSPAQPPWGSGKIPASAQDHVNFGDIKPPKGKKKPTASGGHVLSDDLAASGATPSTSGNHGTGVQRPPGAPSSVGPGGVFEVNKPTINDSAGNPVTKPGKSTVYDGLPPTAVNGLQNQAYNGGNPNGGFTPTPSDPNTGKWQGQAQVPFTPRWDKDPVTGVEGPGHGSGATNHKHAGETVNVEGYAKIDPSDPTKLADAKTAYPTMNTAPPKQPDLPDYKPHGR
ncbi:WXG100 family type VII secretion target [Saccharopolyspora indica]|uniref:WXG100 family type VII secretion target n=1 Tax=Saccharopolyspora indica TaxID=1229659 RepID=UPI0035651069